MDEIIENFFKVRQLLIDKNQIECKNKLHKYLHDRSYIEKQIALLISKLVLLKFDVQRDKLNYNIHIQTWLKLKNKLKNLCAFLCSDCYAIYKSPSRQSVDTHIINLDKSCVSKTPISTELKVIDARTKFSNKDGFIYNGRVKHNNVLLQINETTHMKLSCDYIQLPNDSISIEYLDMFYTRTYKGGKYGQNYKGFDKGIFILLQSCFDLTMSLKNIDKAIDYSHQLLA